MGIDQCGFESKGDAKWRLEPGQQVPDHTTGTPEGKFMVADIRANQTAILEGGLHAGGRESCFQAYYIAASPIPATLKVCAKKKE